MPDKMISSDEAVAALTAAAWIEQPDADDYAKAVTAVQEFCAANAGAMIDPASVEHLINTNLGTPRTVIHCFMGFIGCDWDLTSAIKLAQRDGAVCSWEHGLARHDLLIVTDGSRHWFDAARPADV